MNRIVLLAAALAMSTACSTLATMDGARTLDRGRAQFALGMSVQHGSNPLSYSGIPIPQVELAGRIGLADDVDFGFRAYLLGAGFDVRYRFWHRDRLHLAVAPGAYGFWLPTNGLAGSGSIDFRAPLTAEYVFGKVFSVAGGPRVILRDQWNSVVVGDERGATGRLDVFTGVGSRAEFVLGAVVIGVSGDLYSQPVRHAGLSWSIGTDFGFRSRPRADRTGTDPAPPAGEDHE